ncbi:MAG TPA: Do family serine endopeptidase [Bacteroidia bacterium]|nr:Do family serine endopeptidase [Bacteroidia bacterium]
MKTPKAFVVTLVSALAGLSFGLIAAEKVPAAANTKPDLKIDASPIAESKGGAVVTSYADVLDSVRPAVVSVYSSKIVRERVPDFYRQLGVQGREQRQRGMGSGVLVSADGYILTNNHVVEGADELKVLLNDAREYTARIVGTDPKTDVAVIKIDGEKLPSATLANSDNLRVGDVVFAIGNPLDVGQTVTMGIVSATSRQVGILGDVEGYEDFIQTDAAINQGNSGGALIDARGRLIGINSAILSTSQGNIGIGFAIPINLASSIMHSLIETGTVARGYLGVSSTQLTPDLAEEFKLPRDTKGVVIADLNPADGPAAKAGLKRDDIITAINGRAVSSVDDLRLIIAQILPGTKVTIKYIRDGKTDTKEATLAKRPDDAEPSGELLPGVQVEPVSDELRRTYRIGEDVEGLVITELDENSPYQGVFARGVVIVSLNREAVTDVASAKRILRPGRNLAFVYFRGGYRYITFTNR